MNRCSRILGCLILAQMSLVAVSNAAQYQWNWDRTGANDGGGVIKDVNALFNTVTGRFAFNADFGNVPNSTAKTEGFWLVVSPGANPKGTTGELAIFYMDASKIDGINNKKATLSVYAYNGQNASSSYYDGTGNGGTPDPIKNSIASQSWINTLTMTQNANGTRSFSFDIDATSINNHVPIHPGPGGAADWTGATFGQQIGVWFHPVSSLTTDYKSNGFLKNFSFGKEGYLDGSNFKTTPEPVSMVVLGLGAAAMMRKRNKKA